MAGPIQVILNPENFEQNREKSGGGPKKEFFVGANDEFSRHKAKLIAELGSIADALAKSPYSDIGYIKVTLRRSAWAKSHRPVSALFRSNRAALVGGEDLGVMIFKVKPEAIHEVVNEITKAEDILAWRFDPNKQKDVPYPSARRSEAGAIERIELFGRDDRREFSLESAIAWLSNPITGSSYEVELFEMPPTKGVVNGLDGSHTRLFESFIAGLEGIAGGLSVRRLGTRNMDRAAVAMHISRSSDSTAMLLGSPTVSERTGSVVPFDSSEEKHLRLLTFLEAHPLVRRISLPAIVVRPSIGITEDVGSVAPVPHRQTSRSYPKIGIIDGGLGEVLSDWVIDRWNILASEHASHDHGTFIGGLAVMGRALNGEECCPEEDGAELVDIAVFPREDDTEAFSSYYPHGVLQFFDEVETAIGEARSRHGVRVYNMSLNIKRPASLDRYDPHALRLDRIVEDQDAIVLVSVGNVEPRDQRPEWPSDDARALAQLAAATEDRLLTPAESVRNVAVAAVNPPGVGTSVPFAPARFSRRGPGLRTGVKPDLAHVGGSGSPEGNPTEHGLFSVRPDGVVVSGCGTSYATPVIAKIAASLEHAIEGDVSRETLIALLLHHAQVPKPLQSKSLMQVARQLVGFGVPESAERILETDDHSITLVFASRIRRDQQISFQFSWPPSLVGEKGNCRGRSRLTLVASPPLDGNFGSEFVRVNVDAALQQQNLMGGWERQLRPVYLPEGGDQRIIEAERIQHGLKWSPVKVYERSMPVGVGRSSNWRLFVDYLTRSNEQVPEHGIPFTAILTISDPRGEQPVFDELRQTLIGLGVQMEDIRVAARVAPRV